jgi:hypothetical protein
MKCLVQHWRCATICAAYLYCMMWYLSICCDMMRFCALCHTGHPYFLPCWVLVLCSMIAIHAACCTECQTIQHWKQHPCLFLHVAIYRFCTACHYQHLHAIDATNKYNNTLLLCCVAHWYFENIVDMFYITLHKNALPHADKNEIFWKKLFSWTFFGMTRAKFLDFFWFPCSSQCALAIPIKKSLVGKLLLSCEKSVQN